MLRSALLRHTVSTTYQSVKLDQNALFSHTLLLNLWSHYRNRVKFAQLNIHGIPGFRNVNADITGLSFWSPTVRGCCWWASLYAVEDGACWFVYHTRQDRSKCCIFAAHAQWKHGTSLLNCAIFKSAIARRCRRKSDFSTAIMIQRYRLPAYQ